MTLEFFLFFGLWALGAIAYPWVKFFWIPLFKEMHKAVKEDQAKRSL